MSNKTVLFVDDDVASLNFLVRLVKEQGYFAMAAHSGEEGLAIAWRDRPDLIIFDPVLQDVSPGEFLLKLRRDLRSAHIPVLALSNSRNPGTKEACLKAGCNEYLLKTGEMVKALPSDHPEISGRYGLDRLQRCCKRYGQNRSELARNIKIIFHPTR